MTYFPWLSYAYSPIVIIRSNSVEVRGRPWSHTMSKQLNVELPIVTAEHSLGKSTAVKIKRGRPKKQTEASFTRSAELPDMCAEHGLEKSSDVERKRIRLGEVLTLQQLLTKGVGWFTIIIILVLPPGVVCLSNRALPMLGTADGDAVSRCQVLGRAGSVHHGTDQ